MSDDMTRLARWAANVETGQGMEGIEGAVRSERVTAVLCTRDLLEQATLVAMDVFETEKPAPADIIAIARLIKDFDTSEE